MRLRELKPSVSQALGIGLLSSLVLYAVMAPALSGVDASAQNLSHILAAPMAEHWLGTDHFGRDMWVRLADALQRSMTMALLCVATAAFLGVSLGVAAAIGPKWLDRLLDGLTTLILALPGLVLVLLFAAISPGSFWMLYLAISLIQWIEYFRVTRVITQRLAHSPEVEASRLLGFGQWYRFKRHFWPAIAPQLMTLAAFGAANAILMMAALGFVYVGIQPPTAELGLMIVEHFPYYSDAPWLLVQPLIALALLILSFHLIGGRGES
ncbi:ABC transporter permease [Marinobacter sp. DUT-3]|uniref:ABC transporter permease n=1 Tax=Marinobacter sp. DUT-3 TaxID=3412036 RepID=UPI003D180570